MKSYKNLYSKICSIQNLELAFKKAKKGKSSLFYIKDFLKNKDLELQRLKSELESKEYLPRHLEKFIIRDPKTRVIHSSHFRDRIVHHALVNLIEPIFEKTFIYDSYANRKGKGTLKAIKRFDEFKRIISQNGRTPKSAKEESMVLGYIFKADIKHYFDSVNHQILLKIIKRKINDKNTLFLIEKILNNFNTKIKEKGMPLGNLTSQFFANVYLNELDYFIKHKLKAKYYIRYVDDFVILHSNKELLEEYKTKIGYYLKNLDLELHPEKSKIFPLHKGVSFLGYRIFYYHKLLRKRNLTQFKRKFESLKQDFEQGLIDHETFLGSIEGWLGYARWANTYKFRRQIIKEVNNVSNNL